MPAKIFINNIIIIDKIKTVKIIFDKLRNIIEKNLRKLKFPNFISGNTMGIKIIKLTKKATVTEPKIFEIKILFLLRGRGSKSSTFLE